MDNNCNWKLRKTMVCLEPCEELDLTLTLVPEHRSVIHGIVKFPNGCPVKNAVVKLFVKKSDDCCDLIPVTFTFTDDCGQFLFGVKAGVKYLVKVFYYEPEHKPCNPKNQKDEKCEYEFNCK